MSRPASKDATPRQREILAWLKMYIVNDKDNPGALN